MSNDAPSKNKRFREKYDFPFDLLSDEDLSCSVAYGAAADSLSGKAARISYLIGPNGEVRKVYATVKAGVHPEEVLSDLVDHSFSD